MKFSMTVAVIAAALCMTGCKYDKINEGNVSGDDAALSSDIEGLNENGQGDGSQAGSLASATEGKFEDMYTRCTDVNFAPVYFGFDSTVVPQGEMAKIDAVVSHLTSRTDRVVVIEGNCDERGSGEYNMSLGENRAIIIRNYLTNSGITGDRIQTRSYGAEKPAVLGHDESAYALNRRGEFAIFQK